ncbi:unnamed protein product [Oppiella nova]|uniref:LisH domain-containing protein n=1 Tax=Oppiella nova TaxID=334625 RepID=A0A7R9QPD6_9ACAR|nr:unnamed protein product [Oppiella nova]CAG2169445.1 unnamed protein product [Oppiella nova]
MSYHLMPSEIARLVLGYLKESQCFETEKQFLKESKHLTEYAIGLRHGFNYSTNINGKSLLDIIHSCHESDTNAAAKDRHKKSPTDELRRLSQQLTKVETLLNKLSQTVTTNSGNQSQYRIIQTSSPLFVNPIGVNASPIVDNQTPHKTTVPSGSDAIFRTPSRSDAISPRRKRTPRRLMSTGSTPLKQQSMNESCDQTLVNTSSDQLADGSEPLLRMDINEPLVQPEFIVGELINFEPLHDVLADNINKIFANMADNYGDHCAEPANETHVKDHQICDQNIDPQDIIRINDEDVNHILANLESAPEYNTILDIITEKELQMTPYKDLSSVETNTSSASSLNTPRTPQMRVDGQTGAGNVVKNLMQELRTPEKTITIYASRSPSESTRITPLKVTPVKVFRSDYVPDVNCILNGKPVPIIVPKVSVGGEDYNLIQNSLANSMGSYAAVSSVVPVHQSMASNAMQNRRMGGRKRVDFSKPASELQAKRSGDQIHRKILPKPTLNSALTTNCVPVYSGSDCATVPKQPLLLVNNSNANPKNPLMSSQSECQSEKRLPPKDRSNKRHSSGSDESLPVKIRASDVSLRIQVYE